LLSVIEERRLRVSNSTDTVRKSLFGQFFTPATTAWFMARLFTPSIAGDCRLLDAGAGIGSLSSAFLERCASGELNFDKIDVSAFELDTLLLKELNDSLISYTNSTSLAYKIFDVDFIEEAVNRIQFGYKDYFTHAILNPPYKKINSNSRQRLLLRLVGIETVNLYSAFIALSLELVKPGGQIVAIIPRSFCNGPYYRPFRNFMLERAAIRHIHLFNTRNKAFKDDNVLQENIILMLERNGRQEDIKISTSSDDNFHDLTTHTHPFDRIVFPNDPECFIHIPTSPERNTIELSAAIHCSLEDINITVSTGPVVDFRVKEYLRDMPELGSVPLLYPSHFTEQRTEWPKLGLKKPNAICRNSQTEKLLFPNGFYCVVRRFSSKEEKRRIMASVVQPEAFAKAEVLGFENHLNVFHENKRGLPAALAYGLSVFLNTTAVDENFRRFSGHTQVNVTDLKLIKYPSRNALITLGQWAMQHTTFTQPMIDDQLDNLNS